MSSTPTSQAPDADDPSRVLENKIRSVTLYKHGVGFFEREARVLDNARLSLQFHSVDLDDVLKSFAVFDLDGGLIPGVSYEPGSEAIGGIRRETQVDWPPEQALSGLLTNLVGVRIALQLPGNAVQSGTASSYTELRGEILGLERGPGDGTISRAAAADAEPPPVQLVLRTEDGAIRSVLLEEIVEFRLLDEQASGDLGRSLQALTYWKKQAARRVTIQAAGTGERRLRMRYSVPTPVWKVSYRILLPAQADAQSDSAGLRVQGWALIDNTSEEDWEDVQLELVAGLPVSFQHNLTAPRYQPRPEIPVEQNTLIGAPVAAQQAPRRRSKARSLASASPEDAGTMDFMESGDPGDLAERSFAGGDELAAQQMSMRESDAFADSFQTPVDVATAGLDGGLSYVYRIEHPVSVRRGESALVPLLSAGFAGRRVALYSPGIRAGNPMAAVLLTNDSAAAIEGGPVTVFDADRYAGEGMLRVARPGEQQFLPYAVDLACQIAIDRDPGHGHGTGDQRVYRSVIANGAWILHSHKFAVTAYTIDNQAGEQALELYLEHPIRADMQLVEPDEVFEETAGAYRFRMEVPAGESVRFVVKQRGASQQHIGLHRLDQHTLQSYTASGYLDEATRARVQKLFDLQEQVAQLHREQDEQRQAGEQLSAGQQRIRKNLQAVSGEGDADGPSGDLRRRYLSQLAADEDRFAQIQAAGDRIAQEIAELEQERAAILAECSQDLLLDEADR